MAYISRDYYKELKKNKLIEHGDWIKLERMSKAAGLKDGKGYRAMSFRNVVVGGFTTTDEVIQLIKSLYEPKVDALRSQKALVKEMRAKLENV